MEGNGIERWRIGGRERERERGGAWDGEKEA